MTTKTTLTALAVVCATLAGSSTHAAVITWGTATNVDAGGDVTQISTTGTVHYTAAGSDLGTADTVDGSSIIINGVQFFDNETYDTAFVSHRDTIGGRTGVANPAGDGYHELLVNADRDSSNVSVPITFGSLTIGHLYQIQIWSADNSNTADEIGIVLGVGDGATPHPDTTGHRTLISHVGSTGSGQFSIGTFTADAVTQQLLTRRYQNLSTTKDTVGQQFVNAYQIRDLGVVPEPGPAALLGLGLVGLMLRRRRLQ